MAPQIDRGSLAPHQALAGMTSHRYPAKVLVTEYLYAVIGMVLTLGPFAVTTPLPAITGILVALGLLFLAFGARTVIRHRTAIHLSEDGIERDGLWGGAISWTELAGYKLGYYSTRRDRSEGWMQLKLRADRRTLRIDSQVEGFEVIVQRAGRAARDRGLPFDLSTDQNLRALGFSELVADSKAET